MAFGFLLTELRTQHKISQEELAEKLDVSRQTVRRWEYEETLPDINQIKKMCEIFGVSPAYLLETKELHGKETPASVPPLPKEKRQADLFRILGSILWSLMLCLSVLGAVFSFCSSSHWYGIIFLPIALFSLIGLILEIFRPKK